MSLYLHTTEINKYVSDCLKLIKDPSHSHRSVTKRANRSSYSQPNHFSWCYDRMYLILFSILNYLSSSIIEGFSLQLKFDFKLVCGKLDKNKLDQNKKVILQFVPLYVSASNLHFLSCILSLLGLWTILLTNISV